MAERRQHPNGGIYERGPDGRWHLVGQAPAALSGADPRVQHQARSAELGAVRAEQDVSDHPIERAGKVLGNTKAQQDIAFKPREFEANESATLRGEFDKHPAVEKYREAIPAVADALTAADTAAGDQSIVYAFGKVMDPAGSVREGEQKTAAGVGSLIGQAKTYLDMVSRGQRLPADGRKWLQEAIRNRAIALNQAYTQTRHRYQDLAQKQGFDPELVVGPHEGEPFQVQESAFLGRPVRNGPPKSASPVEFDRILTDMIEQKKPVAEIRQTLADYGSTIPPWQEKILDQYEAARIAGQDPQVLVRTLPGANAGMGLAKGFKGAWDRAAVGAQETFNALPLVPDSNTASQAQQATQAYFSGQAVDPTAESIGRLAGATLFSSPIRGPMTAGAVGNLLMTDSTGIEAVKDAVIGAAGGKIADYALRGAAGMFAPQGRDALRRLREEGVHFSPGQVIGGRARALEDRLTANPVLGPKIEAIRDRGLEAANRIPANRALGAIGQSLPENVPAGHAAVGHTREALGDFYDSALAGQTIGLDPTYVTRLNAIGQRSNLRPQDFDEMMGIVQREIGGAFQAPQTPLGAMSGKDYKKLDSRLGQIAADLRASKDPYKRDIADTLLAIKDQTRALVRRQSPEMASALRAADEGYANYKILERAASANPATGIFSAGQLRSAIRQGDRSVGKGATARGEARMQDLASDMSETLPSTVGSSGTSEREQVNKLAPWVMGSILSPLYSPPAINLTEQILLRQAGPEAQFIANRLRALPRGMFGGGIPLGIDSALGN